MYLVIEGQDATGKSTQVEMLADFFRRQHRPVITLHEPDGDLPQAHQIRDLVKTKSYNLEPLTHVILFTAARLELWHKLAVPILKQDGGVVISARNWWSTLAYQGYGQGVSRRRIITITKTTMPKEYYQPTHSIILTLDDKTRLSRQTTRDNLSATDTFESQPSGFQQKVNHAYLKIAEEFGIPTLDASPSPEDIQKRILQLFNLLEKV